MGVFHFFDHMADVGLEVEADSAADLFLTAGQGLMEWIGTPPSTPNTLDSVVDVAAEDIDSLFVSWLQELLYRFYHLHFYLIDASTFELDLDNPRMRAIVREKIWEESSSFQYREVKAVTYHQLKVEWDGTRWHASVILDV
jgi:SHS2 domain-containing protein